ncbi:hypothetical protein AB0N38_26090 [Micromonospora aurantiaca]|uniref:hypothetical protein n=1 Tax=Micromonospora aurantiaca (nom. illeg.) TaxID=47850 RepID=UPI003439A3B7
MLADMDIRADIYDSDHRFRQTERYAAEDIDEAKTTGLGLARALGHAYALVYVCDGSGGAILAAEVEVDR